MQGSQKRFTSRETRVIKFLLLLRNKQFFSKLQQIYVINENIFSKTYAKLKQ